ncbi:hypothetical protein VOLCADRAFT_77459 [Volvox carteri f. nagariensis]|uniref:Trehalase n=1 Tax=Volvox carteri f. nagariensis TaxID=3068 RepID=D8UEZ2_VOLCA|nr:uncharacterized protein VOLCADRAFT_77459 [Volvox carteri f. nagariensis]EFJ41727.1 hypothetical protein VOLCADRAFT_77459 [Volvox carteri f. nagariensis]|eukprot:XP_002957229.1 hypothetical protein VOLCADRAFT_77459 [Volvox carteri f. nagariensis]
MRSLGAAVHGLWKTLCRQVSASVIDNTDQHTLLPLPYAFIIPGDRFRECYNWDSYWIIRGLLACDLVLAAEHLVRNLLHLVDVWGFVPNGARRYYTNRSQPPLLSAMVLAVWSSSNDDSLLHDALPQLVRQHRYWNTGNKALRIRNAVEVVTLSRYHAELYTPRPESFREDMQLAAKASVSGREAAALFCDIASAAESGWDFSSRWLVGGESLQHTRTTRIVPADLNAWLYRMEKDIAAIAAHLGDTQLRDEYTARAATRLQAINTLMWSSADGCWHDLILRNASDTPNAPCSEQLSSTKIQPLSQNDTGADSPSYPVYDVEQRLGTYVSNWVPLWCGCAEAGSARAEAAVSGLKASSLVQLGGLLTSIYRSGEQWDAPNAWPPLVHMVIEAAAASGIADGRALADQLTDSWLHSNLTAWKATGHMHEKYDGYVLGGVGRGGEYEPQVGFGWSNGVLMALMQQKYHNAAQQL